LQLPPQLIPNSPLTLRHNSSTLKSRFSLLELFCLVVRLNFPCFFFVCVGFVGKDGISLAGPWRRCSYFTLPYLARSSAAFITQIVIIHHNPTTRAIKSPCLTKAPSKRRTATSSQHSIPYLNLSIGTAGKRPNLLLAVVLRKSGTRLHRK